MSEEDIFDENFINSLQEDLIRLASKDFEEVNKPSWDELKQAATLFKKRIDVLDQMYELFIKKELNLLGQQPAFIQNFIRQKNENKKKYIQNKYLLAFEFDAKVKKYLNQLPSKALYVHTGKSGIKTIEADMRTLALSISGEYRINASAFTKLMAEQQFKSKEEEQKDKEGQDHLKHVAAAYNGVAARAQRYFERRHNVGGDIRTKKENGEDKEYLIGNQNAIIMWKLSRSWTLARLMNMGDLSEAYVAALLTKHKEDKLTMSIGDSPFYSHQLISDFFYGYISGVTNAAAILEEDIRNEEKQFSVKSAKASAPSFDQYYKAATAIEKQKEPLNEKQLENILKKEFPVAEHRNIISTEGKAQKKELYDQMYKELKVRRIPISLYKP